VLSALDLKDYNNCIIALVMHDSRPAASTADTVTATGSRPKLADLHVVLLPPGFKQTSFFDVSVVDWLIKRMYQRYSMVLDAR
jgi:hypothetical protein